MTRSSSRVPRRVAVVALAAAACACSDPHAKQGAAGFVRVSGERLVDERGPVRLSAIRFENGVGTDEPPALETHHDERDYDRARDLGFDTVHFSLDLKRFIGEEAPFALNDAAFAFLDRNLEWAKSRRLRLVLSLDEPVGKTPEHCKDDSTFFEPGDVTRERAVLLWGSVAERYADATTIAGFQLLAAPTPEESGERFQALASEMIAAIRAADTEHLIIVPELEAIDCDYALRQHQRYVTLEDENLTYGFAFDWPRDFTAQALDPNAPREPETYPDPAQLVVDWSSDDIVSKGWTEDTVPSRDELALKPAETSWTYKEFGYVIPAEPEYNLANVTLLSRNNRGTVCFDDIRVEEYVDEEYRTVFELDLESQHGWSLWEDAAGFGQAPWLPGTGVVSTGSDGAVGNASVCLGNTSSDASLGHDYLFVVESGRIYRVRYAIRGENSSPDGLSLVKLDFFAYDVEHRDREAMRRRLDARVKSSVVDGEQKPAALYVYSVGTGRPSFEHGGETWVRDALAFMRERGVSFAYRAYRGPGYGLFSNDGGPVDPEGQNQRLTELFAESLR
jgi:endoglucanase